MDETKVMSRVPAELYKDFRVALALRDETMSEVILRAVAHYVQESKELQERGLIKIFGK